MKSESRIGKLMLVACSLLIGVPSLLSQTLGESRLSFDVATVKPALSVAELNQARRSGNAPHVGMTVEGGRVNIGFMSMKELIVTAYNVKEFQVAGPDWMSSQRFDILARMPEGAMKEQVPQMLQALLTDRFQLKIHREPRESAIYALVVGKDGHKLKEAPSDSTVAATTALPSPKTTTSPDGQTRMELSSVTMAQFAGILTRTVDKPVVDMTGLEGSYQASLSLAIADMANMARASGILPPGASPTGNPALPPVASDPSSNSVFTSIEQMGLRLESRKSAMEFIIVDHVEKTPSEN
jgi:uncharacterized protein (TIGR03435 family)